MQNDLSPPIILASSSPYRKQILERIGLKFSCQSPDIDESALPNENAQSLVERLSQQKALAVAANYNKGLFIGSDQVSVQDGQIIGKPLNHQDAVSQLRAASGKTALLYTGIALVNAETHDLQSTVVTVEVECRELTDEEIERYLIQDKPYDCCGSLKVESLGITLLKRIRSDDPNAITGIPIIQLANFLRNQGVQIP